MIGNGEVVFVRSNEATRGKYVLGVFSSFLQLMRPRDKSASVKKDQYFIKRDLIIEVFGGQIATYLDIPNSCGYSSFLKFRSFVFAYLINLINVVIHLPGLHNHNNTRKCSSTVVN